MTHAYSEDEEDDILVNNTIESDDDLFLDEDENNDPLEITLDDVAEIEEEESTGHKLQTYDPADDGTDNYFDERYFDE